MDKVVNLNLPCCVARRRSDGLEHTRFGRSSSSGVHVPDTLPPQYSVVVSDMLVVNELSVEEVVVVVEVEVVVDGGQQSSGHEAQSSFPLHLPLPHEGSWRL